MKKAWILTAIAVLGGGLTAWARDPGTVEIRGKDIKDTGILRDGTLYTKPGLLEAGQKWKLSEEGDALYVTVTPPGLSTAEKLRLPSEEINGNRYVDFTLFAPRAGVAYEYNEKKGKLKLLDPEKVAEKKESVEKKTKEKQPAVSEAKPVLLLWDPENSFTPAGPQFPSDMGRRIMSPTWGSYADVVKDNLYRHYDYIREAEENGVDVMPLVHNDFSIPDTAKFMRDKKARDAFISRVAAAASVYGLAGINIDFENMAQKDSALFTDFIKDLAAPLHQEGKQLSVDITVYNAGSPTWSLCYDRKGLARYADYEIIMGYDETPGGSRYAGSVSSYNWLEKSVKRLLEEVPADQLILGLPFYTRVWTGNPGWVRAEVLTMRYTNDFVRRHRLHPVWDEKARQYHAKWTEGNRRELWLEERKSLSEKMKLGKEYHLAGYAFWRYGFEPVELYGQLAHDFMDEDVDAARYPNLAKLLGKGEKTEART